MVACKRFLLTLFVFLISFSAFCAEYTFRSQVDGREIDVSVSSAKDLSLVISFSEDIPFYKLDGFLSSFEGKVKELNFSPVNSPSINEIYLKFYNELPISTEIIKALDSSLKPLILYQKVFEYEDVAFIHSDANEIRIKFPDYVSFNEIQYVYCLLNSNTEQYYDVFFDDMELILNFGVHSFTDDEFKVFIASLSDDNVKLNSIFGNLGSVLHYICGDNLTFSGNDILYLIEKTFFSVKVTFRFDLPANAVKTVINNFILFFKNQNKQVDISYSSNQIAMTASDSSLLIPLEQIEKLVRDSLNNLDPITDVEFREYLRESVNKYRRKKVLIYGSIIVCSVILLSSGIFIIRKKIKKEKNR